MTAAMFKVKELIHVINFEFSSKGRRRRRIPAGFCYVCSRLYPRGTGGGPNNPYRHLFSSGYPRPCPHLTPNAPHPTFIGSEDEDEDEGELDEDFADDGFDEGSWGDGEEGAMFDTAILRDDGTEDPRVFTLPPVFGKQEDQLHKQKRRSKNGRLVPMVSENTFLSTNKRGQGQGEGHLGTGDDLHLPQLSNQRASLVAGEEGVGNGRGRGKDPRRLHSERIDRRVTGPVGERSTRSDSALELAQSRTDLSREKTDPPPQPILVSIRNQDGEVVHKTPLEKLPPGALPTEAFVDQRGKPTRKKREKKRRPRSRNDSASPTFSGSITISRETTLSGLDSPDYFLSQLRSASWCECPDHVQSSSRCGECRRVRDHEKWCVSRNTICQTCGKAFKRKYSQLERKSSFSTIPASSGPMTVTNLPTPGSPSKSRHQNCSPTKAADTTSAQRPGLTREASNNRVRFNQDGEVVYPQWDVLPDSGVEDDKEETTGGSQPLDQPAGKWEVRKTALPSIDANVHQRAYQLALADAKMKAMVQKKKSKSLQHPKGLYFSYFPLLKRKQPAPDLAASPTPPPHAIGLRADVREGKQLKVKKGLKHILGDIKLDDYYPGGKSYPNHVS
ncbi:uncharacterized protein LOC143291068 isoform X2 [Babylonia areolata]|uniref:uncharacterized protein LOC143291068 isoform X2 n=1 Tax=Babylonia areolata TaxID=304850 RepID=UPI003FD2CF78